MPRLAPVLALAAALAVPAFHVWGQRTQPSPHPAIPGRNPQQPGEQPETGRPPMPIIDVDFAGGTVQEFVKVIQKSAMDSTAKTPVNVMIPTEAGAIALPAISLKRVSAETALETLRYAFGVQGIHQLEARNMTNPGDEGLTFAIQYAPGRSSPQMQGVQVQQPIQSEAYSLRELISVPEGLPEDNASLRMTPDAVLGALKLAAELEAGDASVAPTQLLFHPDTQLLIARGTPDQHRLIHSILQQLADMLEQRRDQHGDEQAREQHFEMQLLELSAQGAAAQAQIKRAESELGPATAELQRLEKLFQSGSASASEVERARANVEVAKTNVDAAMAQLQILERRSNIMHQQRKATRNTPSEEPLAVIYDLRDLSNFKADFYTLVKQVIKPEGSMSVKPAAGDPTGSIVVSATRPQHEVLVAIFNTARRLKTNEPKLPGTTLDALIEQSKE